MGESKSYTPRPCPRCGSLFVCKEDDIAHCQCSRVDLSPEDRAYIAERFEGCLCADCLEALAAERREMERS